MHCGVQEGIDTEKYPVLEFLINDDIQGLFNFAVNAGYVEPEEGYFSKCHLCTDLRRHLVLNGDYRELRPKEFYLHLDLD